MNSWESIKPFFSERENQFILIYLIGMFLVKGVAIIAFIHLLYMMIRYQGNWLIKGLSYMLMIKYLNPLLHPIKSNEALMFFILIALFLAIKVIKSDKLLVNTFEKIFYSLLGIILITSIISSLFPALSVIRLLIYSIVAFTIFQSMKYAKEFDYLAHLNKILILVVWVSLALFSKPAAYLPHTTLFRGAINHSQDFGSIVVPLLIIFIISQLSGKIKTNAFYLLTTFLALFELLMSGSRSAVAAILLVVGIYLLAEGGGFKFTRNLLFSLILLANVSVLYYVFNADAIHQSINGFVHKYNTPGNSGVDASTLSRIKLMEVSLDNLSNNPFSGVGFNVQTWFQDPFVAQNVNRLSKKVPGTDILYSRPLEKGNVYLALFEESGFIAGFVFLFLMGYLLYTTYRSGLSYTWPPILGFIIVFNAEAGLFSPSGIGNFQLFIMAIMFQAASEYKKRLTSHV